MELRIPEKVRIGGATYTVEIVDRIRDMSEPVGRTDIREGVIEIGEANNSDFMNQTFVHELVHLLHYHLGYNGDDVIEDEQYVDGMANALYMFMKDNPGIFVQ